MALACQTARILFLEAAARSYGVKDPSTSAHLMLQRNVESMPATKSVGEHLVPFSCTACGTFLVPGWTSRTSLLSGPSNVRRRSSKGGKWKEKEKRTVHLIVECLTCRRHMKTPVDPSQKPKNKECASVIAIDGGSISNPTVFDERQRPVKSNSHSRQRAKLRKGGLQALLDKAKQSPTLFPGGDLDLMDLMKQE